MTSAKLLQKILSEEATHVTAGVKWFRVLSKLSGFENENDVIGHFHEVVRKNFRGLLKEPFNHQLREEAGMSRDWYMPLTLPLSH